MDTTFKRGDKVKIISVMETFCSPSLLESVGTVVKVNNLNESFTSYFVEMEDGFEFWFEEDNLELFYDNTMENTMTFEDYPEVRYMPVSTTGVNVVLGSEHKMITNNVQEVIEVLKEYKRSYENACEHSYSDKHCEVGYDGCLCLEDAYENLLKALDPYRRWNLEGVLDRDNEGNFFLGGYKTPIPETLANLIIDYQENGFDSEPLVRFWENVLLNPDQEVRDRIMQYIDRYGITITNDGYMVLYKVVKIQQEALSDSELVGFVASEYMKRKSWGKNPADYYVYDLDEEITLPNNHTAGPGYYVSTMEEIEDDLPFSEEVFQPLGTLQELYENLDDLKSDETRSVYTDKYSGTMDYDLGVAESMPREECDSDPKSACSVGLHVGSKEYIDWYRSHANNEAIMATIVAPQHVVCIPDDHDLAKIRTCEFYPYALMEVVEDKNGHTTWEEVEGSFIDIDYSPLDEDSLEEMLDNLDNGWNNEDVQNDQLDVIKSRLIEL